MVTASEVWTNYLGYLIAILVLAICIIIYKLFVANQPWCLNFKSQLLQGAQSFSASHCPKCHNSVLVPVCSALVIANDYVGGFICNYLCCGLISSQFKVDPGRVYSRLPTDIGTGSVPPPPPATPPSSESPSSPPHSSTPPPATTPSLPASATSSGIPLSSGRSFDEIIDADQLTVPEPTSPLRPTLTKVRNFSSPTTSPSLSIASSLSPPPERPKAARPSRDFSPPTTSATEDSTPVNTSSGEADESISPRESTDSSDPAAAASSNLSTPRDTVITLPADIQIPTEYAIRNYKYPSSGQTSDESLQYNTDASEFAVRNEVNRNAPMSAGTRPNF